MVIRTKITDAISKYIQAHIDLPGHDLSRMVEATFGCKISYRTINRHKNKLMEYGEEEAVTHMAEEKPIEEKDIPPVRQPFPLINDPIFMLDINNYWEMEDIVADLAFDLMNYWGYTMDRYLYHFRYINPIKHVTQNHAINSSLSSWVMKLPLKSYVVGDEPENYGPLDFYKDDLFLRHFILRYDELWLSNTVSDVKQ